MSRMVGWVLGLALIAVFVGFARADQFWISWEGDTYPEQDGWERYTRAGGAQRSLQDGTLVLDGMASWEIVDNYYIERTLIPDPGELFRLDWRVRVDEVLGYTDPLVAVCAGQLGQVGLGYSENGIWSMFEWVWIDFEPGVFHDYTFTSADMETYALYIDGQLAHSGYFVGPSSQSIVCWGDGTEGASSISTWDYARFGIVPAPQAGDANCDGAVDFADINPFVQVLSDPAGYEEMYPGCWPSNADINNDGSVNFGDINPFVELLTGQE